MKAALYARYSTELQSADSIEDQFRVCERLAERHGFTVVARHSDAAISGGTTERPGYQDLLGAARARQIDVIIAEDTSRLWRNLAEQWRAVAELLDAGLHVVCTDVDTRAENFKVLMSVHGAMADVYRDQIAYRTRRGLEGRARKGLPAGGRAYGYIAARDGVTGQREIHAEQAEIVRRIFQWYADGKSPRWIAAELNSQGVPSPGASWNRTSDRLNAKRQRAWVPAAIHGDTRRGTGILNNRSYAGELVWGRSTWKRSAVNSKQRRWHLNDADQVVVYLAERLRIVPQALWDAVKARQTRTASMTTKLRAVIKRNGRLPRHVLSGLLSCEECGGTFKRLNGRGEYGCATHADGGASACSNGLRVAGDLAERKLLSEVAAEILSPEGIARAERKMRELARDKARAPKPAATPKAAQCIKKQGEIDQVRALMKSGALSQAVAQAAIEHAEAELRALQQPDTAREEKESARVIRLLPRVAEQLRQRLGEGNLGLRSQAAILQGRTILFNLFGGKVPMRQAAIKPGEQPYLIARIGLNHSVLLQAAVGGAGCLAHSGS